MRFGEGPAHAGVDVTGGDVALQRGTSATGKSCQARAGWALRPS